MADVKISQLPAATTPLDGTELTPIVQSGTTKRVSVANLTVGRALTASSLTLSTPLSAANGGTGVTTSTGTGSVVLSTTPTFTTSALFPAGTVSAPGISVSGDTNTGIYFPAADTIGFVEGGVEAMRLDASGNVGIGTTSPARPLHVYSASTSYIARFQNAGTALALINFKDSTTGDFTVGLGANGENLVFQTSTTERMRLDSSGNLGLGVTPSAWGSSYRAFQGYSNTVFSGEYVNISSGAYNDNTNWKYISAAKASRIDLNYQGGGGVTFFTSSASGTAGNAISFTQAMTLDASGNLGVGGTPASNQRLLVSGGRSGFYANSEPFSLYVQYNSSTNGMYIGSPSANALSFSDSGGTERMRIDASGNVGIGTTPATTLHVYNATTASFRLASSAVTYNSYVDSGFCVSGTTTNHPWLFYTNNTERARIDASGNLLVGTTSSTVTADVGIRLFGSFGDISATRSESANTATTFVAYSTGASAYRFYVGMGGTVYATNTTITAISDRRLKENIVDLDVGLDALLTLKPRKFDWKAGKGKDIKGDRGWIADEFQQVFPDLIDTWKDEPPEGEEPYKSVRPDLMPVVVKAIQELAAKVTALEAANG